MSYTLTKGDYQESFTKTGTVTLLQCCNNTITTTAVGGSASDIRFGVSVFPWNSNEIIMAWEPNANGHDYVDLGFRVGGNKILFATCNIGAANPQDYGDYFAWGETSKRYTSIDGNTVTGATFEWSNTPYHTGSTNNTGWTKYIPTDKSTYWSGSGSPDNLLTLESFDDVAHVLWGGDWRMPDSSELELLISSNVTYAWTSNYNSTGVVGLVITGKGEYSSASLFLPAAGCCGDSSRKGAGGYGYYWSRSLNSDYPDGAWCLYFGNSNRNLFNSSRYCGRSVRPVLVVPT